MEPLKFYLVTDTHYFDSSFSAEGPAYEARSLTDQKCVAETPAIIDAGFEKLAQDKDTEIILIPGDLVYRGEYQSHVGLRDRFYKLREQGKRIYVTTARHDYSDNPVEFIGDEQVPVDGMPREELPEFYKDFGFGDAISTSKDGMSYVAQLQEGYRLLALNCDGDCGDFKGLWDDQMQWALDEIKKADEAGDYIFAIMHYPLLPYSPIMNMIGDAKLTDWERRANEFADAGLSLIFTGHMHSQAVTEHTSPNGNKITDIQTGCFVGCPCAYRRVVIDDETVDVKSFTIEDFDYDKGGKTAEEYFQWRFDRMIDWKMSQVLPKPAQKFMDKFTLKKLGRLLWFRVDDSIKDRLVKDLGVELVRNIFVGNEPYVKGTPMYEAFEKFLKRAHPVIRIVEKKMADKSPVLADIDSFLLETIGDEKQMDYSCTISR